MQSYLQYRRLGNAVRKQLAEFPVQHVEKDEHGASTVKRETDDNGALSTSDSESSTASDLANEAPDTIEQDARQPSDQLAKSHTRKSEKTAIAYSLPGVTVRDIEGTTDLPSRVFIVGWDGINDPQHPRNWAVGRRISATLVVSALGWIVGAASSINSGVLPQNDEAFAVSDVVGSLVDGNASLPQESCHIHTTAYCSHRSIR